MGGSMMTKPPTGLHVSEKLLRDYRALQDRLASPKLDRLGIDRTAEKLESRRACKLYPWTPPRFIVGRMLFG